MAQSYARRCIEEARPLLQSEGEVVTQFITSSLDRMALGTEPDLVFVPHAGPSAEDVFIVEFKEGSLGRLEMGRLSQASNHQLDVLKANDGIPLVFILATDVELTPDQIAWCHTRRLRVLQQLKTGRELATALRVLAGLPEHRG